MQYYDNVLAKMGGLPAVQSFYRFYVLPGVGHAAYLNGTTNKDASPPVVTSRTQLWDALKDWVEKGTQPSGLVVRSSSTNLPQQSLPLCAYPSSPTYKGGIRDRQVVTHVNR